ncbi:MAG: Zn-dependent protease [Halobacteriovorax sp.]|nr:Zn-dependent protease [Halobacteriovorax sp.]
MKSTVQKVIDMALSMGANECEVIINKGSSLSLKANEGKLEEHKVSGSQVVGVRLKNAGRLGTSYSENFEDESLRTMVKTVVETSKYSKLNEFESISAKDDGSKADATNEFTWQEDHTSAADKVSAILKLEGDVLAKGSPFKSAPYNSFSESEGEKIIANHHGLYKAMKRRYFSAYTSALVEQDGKQSMHYYGSSALTFKGLDLEKCINESCDQALGLLNGTPVKTGQYSVVFDTDNLAELWGCFLRVFSAKAAIDKVNPWAKKLGSAVASKSLTLIDEPRFKSGLSYQSFDDEGVKSESLKLIDQGVLANFLHNTATANELKTSNNGRAGRGPRGSLGVSSTHLVFAPGTDSDSDVHQGKYLEIVSLQGLHSGVDVISGDFSFGGSGYLIENGTRSQAVRNITISGNFYELIQNMGPIGKTIYTSSDCNFFAPAMRFENISVAGV